MNKLIEVTFPFNVIDILEKNDQYEIYALDEETNKIIDELKKNNRSLIIFVKICDNSLNIIIIITFIQKN